jgi:hypothetical protein
MAYNPIISGFTNCCGIIIPNNFFKNEPKTAKDLGIEGYSDEQERVTKYNAKNNLTEVSDEAWAKRIRDFLKTWCREYQGKKSYFLLTLNAKEAEVLEPVVLDLGFEILIPSTHNPTGTSFTLYVCHLLPKEKQEVKSIFSK